MSKKRRKPVTLKDRMTPCLICLHPLSQKHHLLQFSAYGEFSTGTIQLCANCHDLYHLLERFAQKIRKNKSTDEKLFDVQSEEEKLIESIVQFRYEYIPLMHLAVAVVRFRELICREGDFSSYPTEEYSALVDNFDFIKRFKAHVTEERKKRDERFEVMRKEGLLDSLGFPWMKGE